MIVQMINDGLTQDQKNGIELAKSLCSNSITTFRGKSISSFVVTEFGQIGITLTYKCSAIYITEVETIDNSHRCLRFIRYAGTSRALLEKFYHDSSDISAPLVLNFRINLVNNFELHPMRMNIPVYGTLLKAIKAYNAENCLSMDRIIAIIRPGCPYTQLWFHSMKTENCPEQNWYIPIHDDENVFEGKERFMYEYHFNEADQPDMYKSCYGYMGYFEMK